MIYKSPFKFSMILSLVFCHIHNPNYNLHNIHVLDTYNHKSKVCTCFTSHTMCVYSSYRIGVEAYNKGLTNILLSLVNSVSPIKYQWALACCLLIMGIDCGALGTTKNGFLATVQLPYEFQGVCYLLEVCSLLFTIGLRQWC